MFLSLPQREQDEIADADRALADIRIEDELRYERRLGAPWCTDCRAFGHEPGDGCQRQRRSGSQQASNSAGRVRLSAGDDPIKALDVREYLRREGVDVPSKGKVRCIHPQHPDRNPSMSVAPDHFRCWSCGAHGDIIEAASLLHAIPAERDGYWRLRDLIVEAFEGAPEDTRRNR
jgi:hypothetical protein